jgi:hypothetical protein
VFGRTAGERAATVAQRQPSCLREDEWLPVTFREMLPTDQKYGINTKVRVEAQGTGGWGSQGP